MTNSKIGRTFEYAFSSTVPVPVLTNERSATDIVTTRWQPFGSDNLFPQAVSALTRKSPVHRAIIRGKAFFTAGLRVTCDESQKDLHEFIKNANNKGEGLRKVSHKVFRDINTGGNGFLEFVTDAKRSFLSIFHKDFTTGRAASNGETILLHPNWAKVNGSEKLIMEVPLYPQWEQGEDGYYRCMIHIKDYEPEFRWYGVPGWIAALDSAAIAYKTNKWNVSRLDNSFQSSGVLLVDGNMGLKEAKKFKKEFYEEYTGEGQQGKIMLLIKQLGGEGTKFESFAQEQDGDWINLHTLSTTDLISAHSWYRSLASLPDNTGFDTKRVLNEYQMALSTVIRNDQETFLEEIRPIIEEVLGYDTETISFVNEAPVSLLELLDVNAFVKIGEGRKMAGLEVDEDDPLMEEYIKPRNSATNVKIDNSK